MSAAHNLSSFDVLSVPQVDDNGSCVAGPAASTEGHEKLADAECRSDPYMDFMGAESREITDVDGAMVGDVGVRCASVSAVWPAMAEAAKSPSRRSPHYGNDKKAGNPAADPPAGPAASAPPVPGEDPPRPPKRPINPYLHFAKITRPSVKEENPGLPVRKVVSIMATMWRGMTAEQKAPFVVLADQDKQRYAEERARFVELSPEKPVFNRKRKRNKVKAKSVGHGRVKRAAPAYIFFSNKHRREVMNANPQMSTAEVSKVLGQMWHRLPPEDRVQYDEMHERDKVRRTTELRQQQANGLGAPPPLHAFQLPMAVASSGVIVGDPAMAAAIAQVQLQHAQVYAFPAPHPDPTHFMVPASQFSALSNTL